VSTVYASLSVNESDVPLTLAKRSIGNAAKYNYKAEQFVAVQVVSAGESCQSVLSVFRIFVPVAGCCKSRCKSRVARSSYQEQAWTIIKRRFAFMLQGYFPCCVRVNSMVKLLRAHGGCLGRDRR
jgi:hypothetical protein